MRGTLVQHLVIVKRAGIIPAHAGNTPSFLLLYVQYGDHPRACGEHAMLPGSRRHGWGSSPRMRGTQALRFGRPTDMGIIPAHAGNTRSFSPASPVPQDHPRACGEHSVRHSKRSAILGSSPRMRGTLSESNPHLTINRIIPAHAGNTVHSALGLSVRRDHPRACGEHHQIPAKLQWKQGSSPRMRGTLLGL